MENVENYFITRKASTILERYINLLEMHFGVDVNDVELLSTAALSFIEGNLECLQHHIPADRVVVFPNGTVVPVDADPQEKALIDEIKESIYH